MATLEVNLSALASAIGTDIKGLHTQIGAISSLPTASKTSIAAALTEIANIATTNDTEIGTLTTLTTAHKETIVGAVNELRALISDLDLTAIIDDGASAGDTDVAYSADKILSLFSAMETRLLGGITPAERDTIKELGDYLVDNAVAGGVVQQMSTRVRVDGVQAFSAEQQAQGRANLGAASATALQALTTAVGDTTVDLVAVYNTAKA